MDALDFKKQEILGICLGVLFASSNGLYSFCKSMSQDRSGWHAFHARSDASLPDKEHDTIEGLTWSSGFWWNNHTIGYLLLTHLLAFQATIKTNFKTKYTIGYCRRGKDGEQTVQARFLDSAYFWTQWPMTISGVSLEYMSKCTDPCSFSCGYWQGQVCGRFEILYGLEGGKKLKWKNTN